MNVMKPEVVWIIIGLALLIAEFAVPGLVVFFFGLGAIAVGILCFLHELTLNTQIIAFIVSSLTMFVTLRHSLSRVFLGATSDSQTASDDVDEIVGQRAKVIEKIGPAMDGRIEFHGSQWPAASESHLEVGTPVEVIGRDNLTLMVRSL